MSHTASPQVFLLIGPLCRLDDSHLVFKVVLSIVLAVVTPELVGYLHVLHVFTEFSLLLSIQWFICLVISQRLDVERFSLVAKVEGYHTDV